MQHILSYLKNSQSLLRQIEEHLAPYGLTPAQFNILGVLWQAGGKLQPSELSDRLLVTRPTITALLGSLEKKGWLHRERIQSDGRMRLVVLSDAGLALLREVGPVHQAMVDRLSARLTEEEWMTLVDLSKKCNEPLQGE
ncbi:MarR family winged helix-turn-helix transcriptional regulator [Brevibacillus dissolubilis]|uniref:MarR family winged helix-turn-helix transcriptional regulator n=1 Tax=Brevibacillus dissolubilis TaxID=1844116 RepID=UPI001115BFF1|nr:MarR family transcriptional regulator [Brevibacillus dissolubilis]